jgi:hypothetical protein
MAGFGAPCLGRSTASGTDIRLLSGTVGGVTTKHRRFALHDVTFGGVGLPGATVDCWDDSAGLSRWSARIVTRVGPALDEGELTGRMADGRSLSGHAVVANRQVGAGGRRETLVELHGSGDLRGLVVEAPPEAS